jgi:tRNA pseudouridine32 synthase/23S rRNA pseudouridine746 synthase
MAVKDMARGLSVGDPSPSDLVHEDAWCLVAVKPAGLLSVPGRGEANQDCLASRLQARYPDALVVHRLDMATSGLWIMGRGLAAQRKLARAFEHRDVSKRYVAVVDGEVAQPEGSIDLPIGPDWPNRPRQQVDAERGRPSVTRFRVLGPGPLPGTTRLELEPVTGRTHQLRVHLMAIGHPIVGDALYAPAQIAAAAPRLWLHATELRLAHPGTGQPVQWSSPPPF